MIVFGLLGAAALWLLYGWLLAAIVSSYLSERKGYGEKPGLASGLLLYPLGVIMWLVWPAREDSKWKQHGAFGRGKDQPKPPGEIKPDS
jgi:O-antigen ligase